MGRTTSKPTPLFHRCTLEDWSLPSADCRIPNKVLSAFTSIRWIANCQNGHCSVAIYAQATKGFDIAMLGYPMNVPVMSADMPRWVTWINDVNIFHVLAMDLFVDRRQAEQGSFYVALEINKICPIGSPHLSLTFPEAHITVGTYKAKVDDVSQKRNTLKKAVDALEDCLARCRLCVHQWRLRSPTIRMAKTEWQDPASSSMTGPPLLMFDLRLCDEAFAVDRLVTTLQKMLSGVAQVQHRGQEGSQRTMGHLRGPSFHLSVRSHLLVTWRPPAGLVDTPPPAGWLYSQVATDDNEPTAEPDIYIFEV